MTLRRFAIIVHAVALASLIGFAVHRALADDWVFAAIEAALAGIVVGNFINVLRTA